MTEVGITLETASARLALYMKAEARVLDNQSYEIAGRKMTRADLVEIRNGIDYWSSWVDRLNPVQRTLPTPRAVGRVRRGGYRSR